MVELKSARGQSRSGAGRHGPWKASRELGASTSYRGRLMARGKCNLPFAPTDAIVPARAPGPRRERSRAVALLRHRYVSVSTPVGIRSLGPALAPKTAPLPLTPFYWDDETEDDDGNPLPPRVPASSTLAAIVPKPTAAPVRVPVEPFTGLEYHIGALKVRPSELKREAVALLTLLLYLAACRAGSFYNKSRATAWFKAHQTLLHEEWAQLGLDSKLELVQDGGDRFIAFATGRRGATSCLITIQTAPNDLFKILYHALRAIIEFGYQSGADTVTLAFTLREPVGTPGAKFVFGVADKSLMRSFRAERWDVVRIPLRCARFDKRNRARSAPSSMPPTFRSSSPPPLSSWQRKRRWRA